MRLALSASTVEGSTFAFKAAFNCTRRDASKKYCCGGRSCGASFATVRPLHVAMPLHAGPHDFPNAHRALSRCPIPVAMTSGASCASQNSRRTQSGANVSTVFPCSGICGRISCGLAAGLGTPTARLRRNHRLRNGISRHYQWHRLRSQRHIFFFQRIEITKRQRRQVLLYLVRRHDHLEGFRPAESLRRRPA